MHFYQLMTFKHHSYISVDEAFARLMQKVRMVQAKFESVPVLKAYGRVLADDAISYVNIPSYDSSHMDGFALNHKDIKYASASFPAVLKIKRSQFKAGRFPCQIIQRKEACRIATGGYLPTGSDTVIPIERVKVSGDDKVRIFSRIPKGSFVYRAGSDIKKGEQVMIKGKILRPQDIGLLAMIGFLRVRVFKKPIVTLIPTGSELTNHLEVRGSGKIPDTHSHIVFRMIEEIGGVAIRLAVTPDKMDAIAKKIRHASIKADLILTLGGSSIGKYDLVEKAINSIGSSGILVHGVRLDRGRVTGLGVVRGKPIIVLPGPIQGAINSFVIFAYPLIRWLSNRSGKMPIVSATLSDKWKARKNFGCFTKVVYVALSNSIYGFKATPVTGQTESIRLLTKAHGYIIVPERITNMKAGRTVQVHLLPGFSYINDQFVD